MHTNKEEETHVPVKRDEENERSISSKSRESDTEELKAAETDLVVTGRRRYSSKQQPAKRWKQTHHAAVTASNQGGRRPGSAGACSVGPAQRCRLSGGWEGAGVQATGIRTRTWAKRCVRPRRERVQGARGVGASGRFTTRHYRTLKARGATVPVRCGGGLASVP